MRIEKRKISELIRAEYNPRKISVLQFQELKDGIEEYGLVQPLVVNENPERKNIIVGGHQRLKIWEELGNKEVDCSIVNLPLDKERKLNIKLNKNGGTFDDDLLKEFFEYEELIEWGFTPDELFDQDEKTEGLIEDDEIPEVKESKVKRGDIWKLGDHRVMCGDSTSVDDVDKLMVGNKTDICFTSPPYNAGKNIRGNFYKNDNDNKTQEDYTTFLNDFTNLALKYSDYVFTNIQILESNKISIIEYQYNFRSKVKDILIWNKRQYPPHINKGTFGCKWEYVIAFSNNGKSRSFPCSWQGKHSNVIETENNSGNKFADIHKAGFPIAFPIWIIEKMDFANSVYDPFLGTGSTLIAADKLGRKCYGMELDEKYCDVIIERWEQFTGLKSEKING